MSEVAPGEGQLGVQGVVVVEPDLDRVSPACLFVKPIYGFVAREEQAVSAEQVEVPDQIRVEPGQDQAFMLERQGAADAIHIPTQFGSQVSRHGPLDARLVLVVSPEKPQVVVVREQVTVAPQIRHDSLHAPGMCLEGRGHPLVALKEAQAEEEEGFGLFRQLGSGLGEPDEVSFADVISPALLVHGAPQFGEQLSGGLLVLIQGLVMRHGGSVVPLVAGLLLKAAFWRHKATKGRFQLPKVYNEQR